MKGGAHIEETKVFIAFEFRKLLPRKIITTSLRYYFTSERIHLDNESNILYKKSF